MSTEVDDVVGLSQDDVFATSELPVPPAVPDAHQGTIESVVLHRWENEKQSVSIDVTVKSQNVPGVEGQLQVFLPKAFVNDIHVEATSLPEEEGNKQQTSFRIGIANSDGTATLQELRKLVRDTEGNYLPGRSPAELSLTKAEDIETFAENHNKMLTGLEVIFTRRPDGGDDVDPRFKNKLRVKQILPRSTQDNPKALRKYTKMWEQ